jgi:hypothetical protein
MRVLSSITVLLLILSSCSSNKESSYYAMDKKYWDVQDYKLAVSQVNINNLDQKELPNLDNPATAPIFNKMVDTSNISVVAADPQLGIKHRSDFTTELFDQYRSLVQDYAVADRTDKYKYPKEYAAVLKFGLCLQLYYIGTNNEKILKEADNVQDPEVVRVTTSNQNILVNNFDIYLDRVNQQDQFTDEALASYAAGIDNYFPRLIQMTPAADYSPMKEKVTNMLGKVKNPTVKASLENLNALLANRKASA